MTRSTVVCSDVLDFTTLRNRLAKYLQPSIWQTLEADKRREEQRARPTNETVCIVGSRGDRRVGSARGARHPHRPVGPPGAAGDRDRGLENTTSLSRVTAGF